MAYRKINYSPEYAERRKAYQKDYARAKRRTPEGKEYNKEAWAKTAAKMPDEERRKRQRDANFRFKARQYGVDPETVLRLLAAGCMLCGKQEKTKKQRNLVLDHDHGTGLFRGILCSACNSGIGLLGDDPRMLERALRYLRGEL